MGMSKVSGRAYSFQGLVYRMRLTFVFSKDGDQIVFNKVNEARGDGYMKMRKKENLPIKTCPACNRPFSWRKKWEKNWEHVIYCSDACRGAGKRLKTSPNPII